MGADKAFSKRAAIKFGWETLKSNFWFIIGIYLVVIALSSIPSILVETNMVVENSSAFWLVNVFSTVISIITSMGIIKIALAFNDGGEVKFSDLFTNYQHFFCVLGASILVSIICTLGIILLIIPGIILALRLQFTMWLIMDEDLGIIAAIKKSWEITRGSTGNLFLYWLLCLLIIILGFIALMVGILIAAPVTWLGMSFIYRRLNPRGDSAVEPVDHSSPLLYEN